MKLGIPDGSMVDPVRGGLKKLLDNARIEIEFGKNPKCKNIPWLEIVMQRPQELPYLAAQGYCDAFICGDDWAKEWKLRGYSSEKLLGLGIGKVEIVVASNKPNNYKIGASEYPFIAKEYLEKKSGENVQISNYGEKIERFGIINSLGKTELKVVYDIADFVVENTQTGSTIRDLGLEIQKTLFNSECSLYVPKSGFKSRKIDRIANVLGGAVNAKDKDLITFNVSNEDLEGVNKYIQNNELYGNEETLVKGREYNQITLELDRNNKEKPLIDVIGDLKDLGARSIEGVPLSYSIGGRK